MIALDQGETEEPGSSKYHTVQHYITPSVTQCFCVQVSAGLKMTFEENQLMVGIDYSHT